MPTITTETPATRTYCMIWRCHSCTESNRKYFPASGPDDAKRQVQQWHAARDREGLTLPIASIVLREYYLERLDGNSMASEWSPIAMDVYPEPTDFDMFDGDVSATPDDAYASDRDLWVDGQPLDNSPHMSLEGVAS